MKENVQNDLGREPTDAELAEATTMTVAQLRRQMEVGRAARNKLIKVRIGLLNSFPSGVHKFCLRRG